MPATDPGPPPAIVRSLASAPVDPLTGQPFLCLRRGDIAEAVAFVIEYRRAHPAERSALVLPPISRPRQAILAIAAFTRNDALYLHTPAFGDVPLRGRPPADIAKGPELFSDYRDMLGHGAHPAADRAWPEGLAGDTEERQLRRALGRLQRLGVVSAIAGSQDKMGARLILEFEGMQFGWSPRLGVSYYNGLGDRPIQNSVIEGILFTLAYRREHPAEQAFTYIHPLPEASTPGRLVATTVYTRDGRAYSHHQLTGDLESPLKPSELADAGRVIAVTRAVYQARRNAQRIDRRVHPPAGRAPPDQSPFSSEYACSALAAQGVRARLLPAASESESVDHSGSTLAFEWQGRRYTYTPEMGCFSAP